MVSRTETMTAGARPLQAMTVTPALNGGKSAKPPLTPPSVASSVVRPPMPPIYVEECPHPQPPWTRNIAGRVFNDKGLYQRHIAPRLATLTHLSEDKAALAAHKEFGPISDVFESLVEALTNIGGMDRECFHSQVLTTFLTPEPQTEASWHRVIQGMEVMLSFLIDEPTTASICAPGARRRRPAAAPERTLPDYQYHVDVSPETPDEIARTRYIAAISRNVSLISETIERLTGNSRRTKTIQRLAGRLNASDINRDALEIIHQRISTLAKEAGDIKHAHQRLKDILTKCVRAASRKIASASETVNMIQFNKRFELTRLAILKLLKNDASIFEVTLLNIKALQSFQSRLDAYLRLHQPELLEPEFLTALLTELEKSVPTSEEDLSSMQALTKDLDEMIAAHQAASRVACFEPGSSSDSDDGDGAREVKRPCG